MSIEILALAEHEWAVQVQESQGSDVTYHKVRVEPETVTTLGVTDENEGLLVREAVETYLEHGPATALPHDLTIDWLERNVPGFLDELTARLS